MQEVFNSRPPKLRYSSIWDATGSHEKHASLTQLESTEVIVETSNTLSTQQCRQSLSSTSVEY